MPDGKPARSSNARSPGGPTPDQVRRQLAHILGHRDFEATERTREFLRYVVDETLARRAHRLKGYTIAIEVFRRGKDFDPNIDPIVRIQAGRLRRALEHYYLVAGGGDPIRIDIPKGQYVPTFAPQAAAPDAHTSGAAGPASAELTAAGPTIAVLPPVNVTGESEQSFFVDGLVEEMIGELNRYQDVIAIPCRDLAPLPDAGGNLRDLGRELGARFLLGGSVRRDPATLKASAYLVDASTGRQLWSESFKIPLETASLIETQETIAPASSPRGSHRSRAASPRTS